MSGRTVFYFMEGFIQKRFKNKTVIIDDGWQYDGNGTGDYFDCGPWEVSREKFANFKEFVNKVHELDMKVAVWFPVPFSCFLHCGFNVNKRIFKINTKD